MQRRYHLAYRRGDKAKHDKGGLGLGTNFRYGRTGKSRRAISSARLNGSHRVHLHPIDVIVYDDPVRSNLAAGFALRCIQRLSDPDLATLQCTWRHNRRTRGRSGTVLSY